MLTYLADYETWFGPLRLFRYLSFRCAGALVTALIVGFLVAPAIIARLRALKAEQAFRKASEVGKLADLHAAKHSTPTMGGWIIYCAVAVAAMLWARWNALVTGAFVVYTGMTLIGFLDDFLKIKRGNSEGLAGRWKLAGQAALTLFLVGFLWANPETQKDVRELWAPFMSSPIWVSMPLWFLIPFCFLVLAGSSNAVNLTDGLDGLAIGCTITVALTFGVFAYCAGNAILSNYLFLGYVRGAGELAVICTGVVGAGLAFLWFNAPKADVYMGDTGSLALGGLVGAVAFLVHQPLTLVIVGGVFVWEALSVMLQVSYFKYTGGRRLLRCSPIHHHFEMGGWPESRVVIRFWILSLMCALAGLATLKIR